jgi:hypothetical protein
MPTNAPTSGSDESLAQIEFGFDAQSVATVHNAEVAWRGGH